MDSIKAFVTSAADSYSLQIRSFLLTSFCDLLFTRKQLVNTNGLLKSLIYCEHVDQ